VCAPYGGQLGARTNTVVVLSCIPCLIFISLPLSYSYVGFYLIFVGTGLLFAAAFDAVSMFTVYLTSPLFKTF